MKGEIKYNFVCGKDYKKGWVNVDENPDVKADKRFNLLKTPYPIKNSLVDHILLSHIMEHFDVITFYEILHEAYRILKPGGLIEIRTPHYNHPSNITGFDHKLSFDKNTWKVLFERPFNSCTIYNVNKRICKIKKTYKFEIIKLSQEPSKIGFFIPNIFGFRDLLSYVLGCLIIEVVVVARAKKQVIN